jgi:hypothetical protein
MRAEVESEPGGVKSRPLSRVGMPSTRIGPPASSTASSAAVDDEQSAWAKQEQQVCSIVCIC